MRLLLNLVILIGSLALVPEETKAGGQLIDIPKGVYAPFFPKTENPSRREQDVIRVASFQIQADLITNEDFLRFIVANPSWSKSRANPLFVNEVYLKHWDTDFKYPPSHKRRPVTNISWFAANAYCQWLGYRLPTTIEWEYLASFPLIFNDKQLSEKEKSRKILKWYGEPSTPQLPDIDVASKNSLGIRGLFGQVWEWTYDFNSVLMTNDNRSNSSQKNGLFCGGGAIGSSNPEDYVRFMRYAHRSSLNGRYSALNLGFRCAK